MAISFPNGFIMTHQEPVDNRLVLTKAQMLEMKAAKMPAVYLAVCVDDGQLYLYNATNTKDETTGRFRLFKSSADISLESLVSEDEDNVLMITEEGTLKVVDPASITEQQINNLFITVPTTENTDTT